MDGMDWRRHMLGAKEIVHQKAISGLPKGGDAGFLSTFMSQWESLTAVTTGETPLLDFLTVLIPYMTVLMPSNTIFSRQVERDYYSPT